MSWIRQHIIWILCGGLVLLVLANAWLFLPRYILGERKITADELAAQTSALHDVSKQGSILTSQISMGTAPENASVELVALQHRSDDIVVKLQYQPYEVSMDEQVRANLELAQLVSFTLRDAGLSMEDKLKFGVASQVLAKAAISAQQLQVER